MTKYYLRFTIAIFCFSGLALALSCSKDKVPAAIFDLNCDDTISFSSQIAPMISANCASCHGISNSTGYTLTNHTNISSNATAILNSLKGTPQLMPQGGPALNDSLIQQFECWINQGTLNN